MLGKIDSVQTNVLLVPPPLLVLFGILLQSFNQKKMLILYCYFLVLNTQIYQRTENHREATNEATRDII